MDFKGWMIAAIIGVILTVVLMTLLGYLINDRLKARRNRLYKTLEDHRMLNSSSRSEWMSGRLSQGEEKTVNRFSGLILPIAQLAITAALVVAVLLWNARAVRENAEQSERLSQLELQVHAIAFSPAPGTVTPIPADGADGSTPPIAVSAAQTMQQACANLIGRVADAYQSGESSKIAESLEGLVKRLGCKNNSAP